jgi:hypothetical protein
MIRQHLNNNIKSVVAGGQGFEPQLMVPELDVKTTTVVN